MATIAELLAASKQLIDVSDTPRLDVEILLETVLNKNRSYLFTWPEREVDAEKEQDFRQLLSKRQKGEPIAHILGQREFWSLQLSVSPATLIPRPETELLVEMALDRVELPRARILDLGTGTGAIAIALAKERPDWQLIAVDSVAEAVTLAKQNASDNGVANIQVMESDWFSEVSKQTPGMFDAIVSNPPYIAEDDEHLQQGDVRYEPRSALVSGDQGFADIRLIIEQSLEYLQPDGWLLLEHGYQQADKVRELLANSGYTGIKTATDLAGQERVTVGQNPSSS